MKINPKLNFQFEEMGSGPNHYGYKVKLKDETICVLKSEEPSKDGLIYYKIDYYNSDSFDDYKRFLNLVNLRFTSKEEAATFCYYYLYAVNYTVEKKPLPQDIMLNLEDKGRILSKRKRELYGEFFNINRELSELKQLAKKYNINGVLVTVGDEVIEDYLDKLLNYKITIENEDGENEKVNFLSEESLAFLVGDDGYEIRNLFKKVIEAIDPAKVLLF